MPTSAIEPVVLDQQTRVYHLNAASQMWQAGRILLPDGITGYQVAFPNGRRSLLPATELFVRCDEPIDDPTPFLESRVTESPYLHQRRAGLAACFAEQRRLASGMTGLLSAAIALEPHQIEVARRVLQDPVQRYLLADEVGLGKTIEAGIIIRQYVLDDPTSHRVLIAVPPHLVDQWRQELTQRFDLGRVLDRSIRVVSFEQIDKALTGSFPRMLVVDEVHQLAAAVSEPRSSSAWVRFEKVCAAARAAERLLLLSATPRRPSIRSRLRHWPMSDAGNLPRLLPHRPSDVPRRWK